MHQPQPRKNRSDVCIFFATSPRALDSKLQSPPSRLIYILPRAITISSIFFFVQNSALLALPLLESSSSFADALTIVADASNDILILIGAPRFPCRCSYFLLIVSLISASFHHLTSRNCIHFIHAIYFIPGIRRFFCRDGILHAGRERHHRRRTQRGRQPNGPMACLVYRNMVSRGRLLHCRLHCTAARESRINGPHFLCIPSWLPLVGVVFLLPQDLPGALL